MFRLWEDGSVRKYLLILTPLMISKSGSGDDLIMAMEGSVTEHQGQNR